MSRSQESGDGSQNSRSGVPSGLASDFGPRTPSVMLDTSFPPSFFFISMSGCTFIFDEQKSGVWRRESEFALGRPERFGFGLRTPDFGLFSRRLTPVFP